MRLKELFVIETPPSDKRSERFLRFERIVKEIEDLIKIHSPEAIAIEGYSFASGGQAKLDLPELGGFIRSMIRRSEIPFVEIAPTLNKKTITGSGKNYDKSLMISGVNSILGTSIVDGEIEHNAADAVGMAITLAQTLLRHELSMEKALEELEAKESKKIGKKKPRKIPKKDLDLHSSGVRKLTINF